MALVNKRIINLPERTELNSDDYTVVDGSNGGTAKYKLSNMQEDITTVGQAVEQLSGTVTQHGQQLTTINQNVATNTSDIADLKEDLQQKAPVIINTSDEAEVVTFADSADDMPMKSVMLKLVPHQEGSGDPSPSNVRPISGYTSVNVYQNTSQSTTGATTYPITLPQTVYGGELDVVKGTLKVTQKAITLNGSESEWSKSTLTQCDIFVKFIRDGDFSKPFLASQYKTTTATNVNTVGTIWQGTSTAQVRIGYTPYGTTTLEQFKEALATNPTQIVYYLATPIEITLDPVTINTLYGSNAIWMDADGTIQCDYPADTKMYIDALTAPDDDMIADSNIASGKYFTVNNRLYLSTSAIAQGEAIVVGTNCTETNLAEALNALNA